MENSLERTYNVPLRKGFQKSPKYKRAKKSVKLLKEFLAKHMKCNEKDIKLGRLINEKIWERGYKYPPHHIKVTAVKDEKGIVKAELFGFKYEEPVMPEPVESKETEKQEQETEEQKNKDEHKEVLEQKEETEKKEKTKKETKENSKKEKTEKEEKPKKETKSKKTKKEE